MPVKTIHDFAAFMREHLAGKKGVTFGNPLVGPLCINETIRFPNGDHFGVQISKAKDAEANPVDPVAEYHRSKGCCDGTDPSGCYQRQLLADARIRDQAKEAASKERMAMADEYAGTEPSEGDMAFCPWNARHSALHMGDKCSVCGYRA